MKNIKTVFLGLMLMVGSQQIKSNFRYKALANAVFAGLGVCASIKYSPSIDQASPPITGSDEPASFLAAGTATLLTGMSWIKNQPSLLGRLNPVGGLNVFRTIRPINFAACCGWFVERLFNQFVK